VHITLDGKPVKSVQVKSLPQDGGYDLYFDSETSDLMVFASGAGEANLFVVPEGSTGGVARVCFHIAVPTTTLDASEPVTTSEQIGTTPASTDPTEPAATEPTTPSATDPTEPTSAKTSVEADTAPMSVGEVRAIRFKKAASSVQFKKLTDNFACYYEGEDTLCITAFRAGKVKLSMNIAGSEEILELDVTDKTAGKSVQAFGDLTQDAEVNAVDANAILREAVRIGTGAEHILDDVQRAAADVNFDGIINAKDAACVLMYSAVKATVPDTPDLVTYMTDTAKQTDKEPAKNQNR
jgi:hypothetical protein